MENNTARNFVLQLGSLITLYLSVAFLLVLLFNLINLKFPDEAQDYWWAIEASSEGVRLGIAMLLVFFPAYLILTRKINTIRRQENNSLYLGLTKWLVYLSLLIGGGVLLGDLVAIILGFLNGEITIRFILKATALFVVVGLAFYYYLQEVRGYWLTREKNSIYFGFGMSLIVITSLIFGFYNIETPKEVRELKLDEKQVADLQDMQIRIENYILAENKIPENIDDAYAGLEVPIAPEDREPYQYKLNEKGFVLCAGFYQATKGTQINENIYSAPIVSKENLIIKNPNNWYHGAGHFCFERVVE